MPTDAEIARLQDEWAAEGHTPEQIGARIRELAEAELARADEENDEEEAGDLEGGPDDAAGLALAQAQQAYLTQVFEIIGDPSAISPCPLCAGRGWNEADVQADPNTRQCPTCHGIGIVTTGSLVDGNFTRVCKVCNGAGFETLAQEIVAPVAPQVPLYVPPASPPEPAPVFVPSQ